MAARGSNSSEIYLLAFFPLPLFRGLCIGQSSEGMKLKHRWSLSSRNVTSAMLHRGRKNWAMFLM